MNNGDLAEKWLKMAEEEFVAAEALIDTGVALAVACFHCQQAAEKSIKAWLIAHDVEPAKTHKLEKLIELCLKKEARFGEVSSEAGALTPYAVERRYDADFWPSIDQARSALEQARRIYDFVKSHWN
jgi:HEPN domain-containing protein